MPLPDGSPFPPEAQLANYRYWATCPYWYRHEAVSLALGLEPEALSSVSIFNSEKQVLAIPQSRMTAGHKLILAYLSYDRHVTRRFGLMGYDGMYLQVRPQDFLNWMRQVGLPIPGSMAEVIEGTSSEDDKPPTTSSGDESLGTRERDSLLKLVIGMAIAGYRYDPKSSRGPATTEIVNDLAKLGIPLDPDTVRKYLREARELLPPEPE